MDVLSELITGRSLDGRPTQLDVPTLLRRLVIVINPLGNPDGRSRTPWEVFDYNVDMIEGSLLLVRQAARTGLRMDAAGVSTGALQPVGARLRS